MIKPAPYGAFHLCFFFIGLAAAILLAWTLRKADERQNRIIMLSVGIFLLTSEVYKQLFYTFVIGGGQYQWWIFPFQLCSVPMYLCLIVPFMRESHLRDGLYDFMLAFNLLGGFISFIEPSGLVHEYWTLTLHAFSWHMTLVFLGVYIGLSRRGGRRLRDFIRAAGVFIALCAVAFVINLALWDVSGGSVNMFYVGPATTPIAVFKTIAGRFGWYVNTPLYMLCLCAGAFLFYSGFHALMFRDKMARHERPKRRHIVRP